jgi:hypothetical protein
MPNDPTADQKGNEKPIPADRCSTDNPCDGEIYPDGNPLHRALWGECYIEVEDSTSDAVSEGG